MRFYSIHIYTHMNHFELKVLFNLTRGIKLNNFTFIFFTLFRTHTQAYGSSIALQLPQHLLTLTVKR